ncbi:MAG: hypothetical protein KC589_10765 [Nanoarchaeota archaeon]|nr:hypothetical protein [Nanoarchaeota archaeon]
MVILLTLSSSSFGNDFMCAKYNGRGLTCDIGFKFGSLDKLRVHYTPKLYHQTGTNIGLENRIAFAHEFEDDFSLDFSWENFLRDEDVRNNFGFGIKKTTETFKLRFNPEFEILSTPNFAYKKMTLPLNLELNGSNIAFDFNYQIYEDTLSDNTKQKVFLGTEYSGDKFGLSMDYNRDFFSKKDFLELGLNYDMSENLKIGAKTKCSYLNSNANENLICEGGFDFKYNF